MKGLFSLNSPVMAAVAFVGNILLVNALWLVSCLPVFTIGASSCAMYSVIMKLLRGKDPTVWTAFFRAFRQNFKKATCIFLLFLIPGAFILADCWILISGVLTDNSTLVNLVQIFTLIPAVCLLILGTYAFPLTALFENTVKGTLKNAVYFALMKLPYTLVMATVNILPLLLLYFIPQLFLLLLFPLLVAGGAVQALVNCLMLRKIFRPYLPEDTDASVSSP